MSLYPKYNNINCNDHVNILEHPINDNIVTVFANNYKDETFKINFNPYPFFGCVIFNSFRKYNSQYILVNLAVKYLIHIGSDTKVYSILS